MSFLALLGSTQPESVTDTRLEMLAGARRQEDADAADRIIVQKLVNTKNCGFAFEEPDPATRFNRDLLKPTRHESSGGPTCVALSRLKRTAALAPIMQWMGLGNEATDPNMPPPSDSSILMAYYGKMMAKQRWSKAHNALGALRAMKMVGAGGLGGLLGGGAKKPAAAATSPAKPLGALGRGRLKPPEAPAEPKDPNDTPDASPIHPKMVRQSRMSVSFVQNDPKAKGFASAAMAKLPKSTDIKAFLRQLDGQFAFCILDQKQEYAFAALSAEADIILYAAVTDDGCIMFSTVLNSLPKDAASVEVPKGTYFVGRYNGNSLQDLVFKPFGRRLTESTSVPL